MIMNIRIDVDQQRLDSYLAKELPQYSRAYLQKLIHEGRVTLPGKDQPLKSSWKTKTGLSLNLDIPKPKRSDIKPEKIPLDIVYEDEWLLVINKMQGMVVHPAAGHDSGTLVNAVLEHCAGRLSDLNGVIRPGIVHRIDKDTSGLILVVKNNTIHADIADQIRRHAARRTYAAVVHGLIGSGKGTIDAPIGRDPGNRQKMAVVKNGKPSVTHFEVKKRFRSSTYLELRLESGRTHQIRVHMHFIGHPVIGDPVYATGKPKYNLKGQALHACGLAFKHPATGKMMELESPLPDYFKHLLEILE